MALRCYVSHMYLYLGMFHSYPGLTFYFIIQPAVTCYRLWANNYSIPPPLGYRFSLPFLIHFKLNSKKYIFNRAVASYFCRLYLRHTPTELTGAHQSLSTVLVKVEDLTIYPFLLLATFPQNYRNATNLDTKPKEPMSVCKSTKMSSIKIELFHHAQLCRGLIYSGMLPRHRNVFILSLRLSSTSPYHISNNFVWKNVC